MGPWPLPANLSSRILSGEKLGEFSANRRLFRVLVLGRETLKEGDWLSDGSSGPRPKVACVFAGFGPAALCLRSPLADSVLRVKSRLTQQAAEGREVFFIGFYFKTHASIQEK